MEYILYCDESSDKGKKYGDFFGGCLVSSEFLREITDELERKKTELNLNGEIKWTKVTDNYLSKYLEIMDLFFSYIKDGKIKVRIMFRNINDVPSHPIENASDNKYFKLYYQFIKHAFGLKFMPKQRDPIYIRIYLDQLPDKKEKCTEFKRFLLQMPLTSDFLKSGIRIRETDIAEVRSHEHVLLQCTDIVLGAMFFKLNELNTVVPPGSKRRGKRTVAKEKLYNHINLLIRDIIPNFNVGISTGNRGYKNPKWESPYRHWLFRPK